MKDVLIVLEQFNRDSQIFRQFGEKQALFTKLLRVPTLTFLPSKLWNKLGGGVGEERKAVIYENMVHHNFAIFLQ